MPNLSRGDGDAAFLDAPGLSGDEVFAAVAEVLAGMAGDAILTVFTDDPTLAAKPGARCIAAGIDLIAVIAHESGGATLALRRQNAG